ncbi:MAG: RsmD family RNA methyltransferase [Flavobacteriaceae bacterium]|jgi:16S rRNA (guanine(966)-N(2))-methyltransferase RsmD|nr:RsmD family RNA methyltransferase [Flavobacteriaceae bacterium]
MIRIISGTLKGKRIHAPKHFEVRPTTDFAKEAFFSIINHRFNIESVAVLDLFSGIGSIDYEFASRGCSDITSVEFNPQHVKFIHNTLKELGIQNQVNVMRREVFQFLEQKNHRSYDLIFADPPFDFTDEDYNKLISLILNQNWLAETGQFILEHISKKSFENCPHFLESRKYGSLSFSFFGREEKI